LATPNSVLVELEGAIKSGSPEKRVETLRRITDLFLADADRLNDAQIKVFDDVIGRLIKRSETWALAELSQSIAPIDNAPIEVVRSLARNDVIAVAGPVLLQSARLMAHDLIEIIRTKSQRHLLAISGRAHLEAAVTDQLLSRGNRDVIHKLARNAGARFSETGLTTLVRKAESDESLAKKVGIRLDLPLGPLRQLLSKATDAVRSWLLVHAPASTQGEIQRVMAAMANEEGAPRDFTRAMLAVLTLQARGELNETALLGFATAKKYEETVAALAALCSASVELIVPLLRSERYDGVLIACRAAGLRWSTVSEMLKHRFAHYPIPELELDRVRADYLMLSKASAQRTLGFWQERMAATQKAG
jgi:uncharacterized protein (DUF2336 family)